jgi:hypothetical protein
MIRSESDDVFILVACYYKKTKQNIFSSDTMIRSENNDVIIISRVIV